MKCGRGARLKFPFSVTVLEKKSYPRAGPRPPFEPGPPDICQVCQVEDPAVQRATNPDIFLRVRQAQKCPDFLKNAQITSAGILKCPDFRITGRTDRYKISAALGKDRP